MTLLQCRARLRSDLFALQHRPPIELGVFTRADLLTHTKHADWLALCISGKAATRLIPVRAAVRPHRTVLQTQLAGDSCVMHAPLGCIAIVWMDVRQVGIEGLLEGA